MRTAVARAMLVWMLLSLIGAAVVAVPDDGPRVVSFSRTHGPSAQDLVGLALLLAGWSVFLVALWRVRRTLRPRIVPAAAGILGGAAVVAWSVLTDGGPWWALGAGVLLGVQLWLGVSAARAVRPGGRGRPDPPSRRTSSGT